MERQIKLIWDFRGPNALPTATHHEIHLKDFIKAENISNRDITGVERISDMHAIAFWVIPESEVKIYRDVLKPNRGALFIE